MTEASLKRHQQQTSGLPENVLRVLLVNEPRAYRETIAAALQELCPNTKVLCGEPASLCYHVEDFAPHLIISSYLAPSAKMAVRAWVELYPDHGALSRVGVDGRHSVVDGMELEDLRVLLDQLQTLADGMESP